MELNPRQKAFCEHFVSSGNATEAARKAGYSESSAEQTASRLLTNNKVKAYIKELNAEIKSSRIMTMLEIQEFWTETIKNKENRIADRLKASELLAKTNGAFLDKIEIQTSNPYEGLTTEELKRLANGKN